MDIVPFFSLQRQHAELRSQLDAATTRVTKSGRFILGDELENFEIAFASYCGVKHAIGVGNGLEALALILRSLDVGPGHEVIVPGHTFIATWLAVRQTGAVEVPVDIDANTYNIDPSAVVAAITDRTRAIIPVHLYGLPADMDALTQISKAYNIPVIEDAAQAHGATYKSVRAGNLGLAAAFSFYPTKNLGALGDGGAITTNDDTIAERVRSLRNYGSRTKYCHEYLGGNSRLDELQAAYLSVKLASLDSRNLRRRAIADKYNKEFHGLPGITLPDVKSHVMCPAWHLYVLRIAFREQFQKHLNKGGVETMIHYPTPPHHQPCYSPLNKISLPQTELASKQVLSLPMWPELTEQEVDQVSTAVRAAARDAAENELVSHDVSQLK